MKKKTRILFLGSLPPPVHGSAVVSQQIKDSKLINEIFDCDWVNLSTSRRMEEIGTKTIVKPFRLLGALCNALLLLLTKKYDLCYLAITCHGIGFLKDSPFIFLCKLFGKKIVIHQHNKGMANDVDRWPYRWLLPLCYKNAKVILLSWYLYPDIEKVVKKENVLICPNGIKVDDNRVSNTDYLDDANRVLRLLFLSNLIESKGVLVLLDALKILKDRGCSFSCVFVGGETKEIDVKRFNEEVEKRGLNETAFYQGRKYGEEKERIFKESDIFVFPSYYNNECFPLVLLEAMQHGLPCVTTDEGGIRDIVAVQCPRFKDQSYAQGECGFVCEKRNAEAVADALMKLIVDADLRTQMGEVGKKRVMKEFSEELFEKRIKGILEDCI